MEFIQLVQMATKNGAYGDPVVQMAMDLMVPIAIGSIGSIGTISWLLQSPIKENGINDVIGVIVTTGTILWSVDRHCLR